MVMKTKCKVSKVVQVMSAMWNNLVKRSKLFDSVVYSCTITLSINDQTIHAL